jgi:membrane-bound lytic murein transglycosylase A
LIQLSPDEYPSFSDKGDEEELKKALRNQIKHFSQLKQPTNYYWGRKTISSETLRLTLEKFLHILGDNEAKELNQLIKTHFDVYQSTGENGKGTVTFTGYYIPQVEGSLKADEKYSFPLYRLPDDLIIKEFKPHGLRKAVRIESGKEYPYYTRKQIDQEGVLGGKCYEIVYLKDPLDCYLIHVQGSGTIILPDGKLFQLHFAGSNYYPYRSLREEMIKDGILSPNNASMESIRSYFSEHPKQLQPYLNRNERYTFFRLWEGEMVGSLGVHLTPGRSIATDKQIFPSGALSYIVTTIPSVSSSGKAEKNIPWSGFVLNQDEGGAIRGPHRADIFWGTGPQAEVIASHLKHPGKLYYLIVKNDIN